MMAIGLKTWLGLALVPLLLGALAACDHRNKDEPQGPLAIIGFYPSVQFGEQVTITSTEWTSSFGAVFHILDYNNFSGYLIAQNDHVLNFGHPDLYTRFDWIIDSGHLYYCQTNFDQPNPDAARAGYNDRSNPAAGGCGVSDTPPSNFPWTQMN